MNQQSNYALLAFSLGPVQTFISRARTVRDLWTGSYLISWLTATAMYALEKKLDGKQAKDFIVSPNVDDNLLLQAMRGQLQNKDHKLAATIPCSPHRFVAEVPMELADELKEECVKACQLEWENISQPIWEQLHPKLAACSESQWDFNWDEQIKHTFSINCFVIKANQVNDEKLKTLDIQTNIKGWKPMELIGAVAESMKMIRTPSGYVPKSDSEGFYPYKCSLDGIHEQMGPGKLSESDAFWSEVSQCDWGGFRGSRLAKNDRFCAISMVRRFAWSLYFSTKGRIDLDPRMLRFSDSATVAARFWLKDGDVAIDPQTQWQKHDRWSGQWLHWKTVDQGKKEKEEDCPDDLFDDIKSKRKKQGNPPTYYAILMTDGDKMGNLFRGVGNKHDDWGEGKDRIRKISEALANFAQKEAKNIIENKHSGEMIYSGGDDTLGLLPTRTVLQCALGIQKQFETSLKEQTLSGGIVVVHHKEDLRFALDRARDAEKASKKAGRNALTLTVCRRSGEHQSVTLGWKQVPLITQLVDSFIGTQGQQGISDRWAYKLRAELPTLLGESIPWKARTAEAERLLNRIEGVDKTIKDTFIEKVLQLLHDYHEEGKSREKPWKDCTIFTGFVTLCQSASFLARGRDE